MGLNLKKAWSKLHARKTGKRFRKALGLTSSNKWARSIKRTLRGLKAGNVVSSSVPTSAPTYYHQSRTLSQLTGGV